MGKASLMHLVQLQEGWQIPEPGKFPTTAVPVIDQSVQPSVGETSTVDAAAVLAGSIATTAAVPEASDAILSPARTPETLEPAGRLAS